MSNTPLQRTIGDGVLRLAPGITRPRVIRRTRADYSSLGETVRAFEGILLAEVIVSGKGRVEEVRILRSVKESFDRLFLEALKSSVYEPATLEGAPVAVCLVQTGRPHP